MFERMCSGHEFFSLTPTERTKLRDTEKKQKRKYKTKKEERVVERRNKDLTQSRKRTLVRRLVIAGHHIISSSYEVSDGNGR